MSYDEDLVRPGSQGPGLLTAIRRHPLVVVASVLIAAALGVLATLLLPTNYTAQAEVLLGQQNQATVYRNVLGLNATALAQSAAQVMRSQAVYDRASEILAHRLSASDVEGSVSVSPGTNNPLVTVTATETSARLARDVANAEAQAYLDVTTARYTRTAKAAQRALKQSAAQLSAQLASVDNQAVARAAAIAKQSAKIANPADRAVAVRAALDSDPRYQSLLSQANSLQASLGSASEKTRENALDASLVARGVDTVYAATTPDDPTSSNMRRNVAVAAALGLVIGAALAWRRFDRRRGLAPEQVAAVLGAPLLGQVRRDRELRNPTKVIDLSPGRQLPDDLRVLASSLMLHMRNTDLAGSVITSAKPGEGKTVLALNLAAAASSAGHDVVLIDGDVRNAALSQAIGMADSPGLVDMLAGASLGEHGELSYAPNRTLPVIPVGRRNDGEAPATGLPVLRRADGTTPTAIVDSPSISEDPATLWLAAGGAGLVVVVSAASRVEDLRTLRSRAELASVPILGFIANEIRARPNRGVGGRPAQQRHRRGQTANVPAGAASAVPSG